MAARQPSGATPAPRKRQRRAKQVGAAKAEDTSRQAEAWRLRVREGRSYREIAEALGVHHETARGWCKAVRDEVREDAAELIDSVTTEALERLRRAVAIALEEYETTRDPKHANALVAAEKRLADLVGADAPRKTEVSGPAGAPLRIVAMTDEDLERMLGDGGGDSA